MKSVMVQPDLNLFLKASKEFAESPISSNELTRSHGYGVMYDIVMFQQALNKGGEVLITDGLCEFISAQPSSEEFKRALNLNVGVGV